MEVTRNDQGNTYEVGLTGSLVFSENRTFRNVVDGLSDHSGKSLVFNLSDLEFIDSAGLGMLLIAKEEADKFNMPLVVRGAQGQVKEMFEISSFSSILTIE